MKPARPGDRIRMAVGAIVADATTHLVFLELADAVRDHVVALRDAGYSERIVFETVQEIVESAMPEGGSPPVRPQLRDVIIKETAFWLAEEYHRRPHHPG